MGFDHPHSHKIPAGEEPGWLDQWANVKQLLKVFFAACAVLLALDLLALPGWYDKHPHFWWEKFPGFYGFYGLLACVALVLAAKQLRKVVMRHEDYYEGPADAEERADA